MRVVVGIRVSIGVVIAMYTRIYRGSSRNTRIYRGSNGYKYAIYAPSKLGLLE